MPWVTMETVVCSLPWLTGFLEMQHPLLSRANPSVQRYVYSKHQYLRCNDVLIDDSVMMVL